MDTGSVDVSLVSRKSGSAGRAHDEDRPAHDWSGEPAPSQAPKLADLPWVKTLHILLAEDMPANQLLVCRALARRGHKIAIAGNGSEAIDLATKHPFDVILMDVQMPVIDGLQATAALRENAATATVPIIALTAHTLGADRQRCLDAGMNEFLTKPLDLAQLVQTIEAYAPQTAADRNGP